MRVSRQELMEYGFIILRNVVPGELLNPLRASMERMIRKRMEVSAQRRLPNEPPGGAWEASPQPRLNFDQDCDEQSALAVEFLLHENTLGVGRQLIEAEHVVPHNFNCLCSAVSRDFGPAQWHRDVGPAEPAPLRGMIANMMAHGPSYLQWNIALYDDRVFWIVPRSHLRINTDEENRQLAENPSVPLPGSIPVELGAGDGVVYTHLLLHWGSDYTRKLRRTIHPGYRPFGFASLPNVHWRHWTPGFFHYLSPEARSQFERWDRLFFDEFDVISEIFHAAIARDADAFRAGFEKLHSSPHERLVTLVMLSRMVDRLYRLKHTNVPASTLWGVGRDMTYFGSLFTPQETADLRERFTELDDRLKYPEKQGTPGFQGNQSIYNPNDMPERYTVEDFIAGWSRV